MKAWIEAARLRTLPLALSSILMGGFLAAYTGDFRLDVGVWSVLTTIFLQVLSNFANDYGDAVNGKDTDLRQGPQRAVQSGQITATAMRRSVVLFALLSLCSGLYLLYISLYLVQPESFWIFLGIGLAAIVAAITYTAGARPYGYVGLGDVSVLIFFGWVGVLGSYYLHSLTFDPLLLLPATSCGLFAVAVLNINNIRDIESDRATGKNSIPVRIGRAAAVGYHYALLSIGALCAVLYTALSDAQPLAFLYVMAFPLLIVNALAVTRTTDPKRLDPYLKQMALTTLLFVLLFGVGLLF